jgi:hypothetical protein
VKNAPCTEVDDAGVKTVTKDAQQSFTSIGITQTGSALAITVLGAGLGMQGNAFGDAKGATAGQELQGHLRALRHRGSDGPRLPVKRARSRSAPRAAAPVTSSSASPGSGTLSA